MKRPNAGTSIRRNAAAGRSICAVTGGLLLMAGAAGCTQLAAMLAVAHGGDTINAEYKFDERPVALLVDNPDEYDVPPEAVRELHEDAVRLFEANKIKCRLVSFEETQRLRTKDAAFDDMSIRQIGEKLGADQVLYLRVRYWATKENPGDPHFKGSAKLSVKVISTERKHDVRLWPKDGTEKSVDASTDPSLSDAPGAEVEVSRQLASKLADTVTKLFYDHTPKDR